MTESDSKIEQRLHGVGYLQLRNLRQVSDIWTDAFPKKEFRPVTFLEKAWMTVILVLDCFSLCDTMKWICFPSIDVKTKQRHLRRCFVDGYASIMGVGMPVAFLVAGWTHWVPLSIATYLLAEMLLSTVKVQFVNTYDKHNRPHSPSRSVVLLLMGYTTVVLVFALLYKATMGVVDTEGTVISDSFSMLYFSLMTIATVGYGDLHPAMDSPARWLSVLQVAIGILMIVVLLTRFLGISIEAWEKRDPATRPEGDADGRCARYDHDPRRPGGLRQAHSINRCWRVNGCGLNAAR